MSKRAHRRNPDIHDTAGPLGAQGLPACQPRGRIAGSAAFAFLCAQPLGEV